MHGELLHGAVDRHAQHLQSRFLRRLDDILREPRGLGLGRRQLAEPGAAVFLDRLLTRLDDRRQCRLGLLQMALLHAELLLLLDQLSEILKIDDLGADLTLHQVFADVGAFLQDRNHRLDFRGGRGIGCSLCLALRALAIESGKLGALLGGLVDQQLALCCQKPFRRTVGWMKGGERVAVDKRRAQPRGIELLRNQIALQMPQLGIADRRVELD